MDHSTSSSNSLSDNQLWDQLREGHQPAYLAIYEQYADTLYKYGAKFTPDREQLLDCLHDLFLDLWERRQHLGATDSIKFYLFRALRRRIAQSSASVYVNKEEASTLPMDSSEFQWMIDEAADERRYYLQQTIESLPKRQREAIYLRYFNNFTFEEIAGIMKIDVRSAQNLTYKALAKLRVSLSPKQQLMLGATITGLGVVFANLI